MRFQIYAFLPFPLLAAMTAMISAFNILNIGYFPAKTHISAEKGNKTGG